jgi:hypothetical protein
METEEIRRWCERYNQELPKDVEEEARIAESIQRKGHLSREDLISIMEWKFARMGHVLPKQVKRATTADENLIRELSRTALAGEPSLSSVSRVKILQGIPGVGPAVASVILAFWAPKSHGVYDFHAWNALALEGLVKEEREETAEEFIEEYLPALQKIARKSGMSVRDVEKAYFWKDCQED